MTIARKAMKVQANGAALALIGAATMALTPLPGIAVAAESPPAAKAPSVSGDVRVTELNRDKLSVYDEHARFQGKIDKWKLPKEGLKVEAAIAGGYLGVTRDGKRIFLRQAEVTVSGLQGPVCVAVNNPATAKDAGRPAISTGGISAGLGGGKIPCVPQ
ncbi:hypothetical protein [Novosphingobium jiangmenense]|uniref:Uncharacterized protein n=1 Tax=Novosphingobium jiangmenense TaxID=2791981 RepID=A0ABS0HC68_9SPHN|nr:hypothetical protein [Novosphingobium jiangmenense]MBF9149880.1 hypothetical protein [Novosphingobium jiangmenense]